MKGIHKGWGALLLFALALGTGLLARGATGPEAGSATPLAAVPAAGSAGRLVRDGIAIDFEARPLDSAEPIEGGFVDLRFRLTDSASGQPLGGDVPGAWLDQSPEGAEPQQAEQLCRSRIGLYLKGLVGVRPLLDLNSYYLLVLNKDPSITVIDPLITVGGVTSMLSRIVLKRSPMDWAQNADGTRLYVSMPDAGQVAVIDTERFEVIANVDAGKEPVRLALQPGGDYLWVGNNVRAGDGSGVTVIDTRTLQQVMHADTGKGHHEIVFDAGGRHAFVSSRDAGTLTVFDLTTRERLREIRSGPHPLGVALSPLSGAVYVSDGEAGTVSVIDAASLEMRKTIEVGRGIGPLAFTPDGRYGFVLNTPENGAVVIDAASDEIVHRLEVAAEPYQVVFTRAFAYVRGLASPRVSMVDLASLGKGHEPRVLGFEAGPAAPKLAGDLPLAASIAPAGEDAALFVVNPVDNTTYFYMEGMNAPMSGYLNRGHVGRAPTVVRRSLREVEPGVFGARVKLPVAGRLDVAFLLNQPEIAHCFSLEVRPNPALQRQLARPRVEFLLDSRQVVVGAPFTLRLRLVRGREDAPLTGVADLRLRYFLAPSAPAREVALAEVGEGIYEAPLQLGQAGAYYLHLGAASLGMRPGELAYLSLRAVPAASGLAAGGQ